MYCYPFLALLSVQLFNTDSLCLIKVSFTTQVILLNSLVINSCLLGQRNSDMSRIL